MTRGEQAGVTRSEREPKLPAICRNCGHERTTQNAKGECMKTFPTWREMWPKHEWYEISPRSHDAGTELDRSAKTEAKHSDGGSSPR